jgi:hypothetical protein
LMQALRSLQGDVLQVITDPVADDPALPETA